MTMISYAQNYEDVMLERSFKDVREGFYVDAGAWHPKADSVTQAFYARGWHGINIEPNPECFALFNEARPRDINLAVGLSNELKSADLYVPKSSSGLGTLVLENAGIQEEATKYSVQLRTLSDVLSEHAPKTIHFLKIDVEGMERAVIQGNDWSRFRPQIILIEATKPNSPETNHEAWEPLLLAVDYLFVWFDGLNRFYVAKECEHLRRNFVIPPNFFDHFVPHKVKELETAVVSLHSEISRRDTEIASKNSEIESLRGHLAKLRHRAVDGLASVVAKVPLSKTAKQWVNSVWQR